MTEQEWRSIPAMCQGEGEYTHFPAPMVFERLAGAFRDGALYRCLLCNGRKFVWKTGLVGNIEWEWHQHPNRKAF